MTYRLANAARAIIAAHELNKTAPDGIQYRARRYPDGNILNPRFYPWGVIKLERVPDHLRLHWPDGFKPDGFHWFA